MAAETSHFRLPPTLNVTDGNVVVNYKKWKRQVEVYLMACGATEKSGATQVAIILNCAGGHILDIFDQFQWEAEDDKKNKEKLFQKLEEYCNPRRTEVVESFRFWNHKYSDSDNFDTFLTELRTRSDSCNFVERDRNIRDKIVFSVTGKLQELLLREENLDLTKAIKICRAYEQSNKHVKELRETLGTSTSTQRVNRVYKEERKSTNFPSKKSTPRTSSGNSSSSANQKPGQHRRGQEHYNECDFCGYRHKPDKSKCPAWGKTCDSCKGRNHFKGKCKKINAIMSNSQISEDEEFDNKWLAVVKKSRNGNFVTACMNINDLEVRFQLDTASDVNTINEKYVHKKQIRKTTTRLLMWNRTNLNPIGEAELIVINPRTGEAHKVLFIVVPDNLMCLLGLKATQEMSLITFNDEKFISSVKVEPLGNLGEVSLVVDPNVREKALPCRKVPLSLEEEVKRAIDILVERSILVPVTEPTKWVSQMAVVRKPTGALRICIDPQPLNSALIREYYKLPTLDDVLPKLHNARIFSKVDVREAYYHCCLDEESSLLTTMITPFGRYRWSRLPFGLKVSSEIFQRKLIEVLGDLHGVFTIADDIIVVGCGSTDIEAKRDNERKLASLYQRCEQQNIRLNDAKKEIAMTEISFHGHRITRDGVKVDNAKVRAILDMKPPTDVSGVKRYCGMIQYMAKFLPDLASTLEPIRALTL